ncbi:hypothetical protein [Microbacterium sp. OR16]|uniref:hypothetical protein n=1 Tax=Microbacterium sp. OR16 TaxID=3095345 RepID=UPI0039B3AEB9
MHKFTQGLRCQDVSAGLRNLHPSDAVLAHLEETQRVGMASGVAALIRGRDVIDDAANLRAIVADQLDIPNVYFDAVVETLEEAGMVSDVVRNGRRITSFNESVPFYSDLYPRLGEVWQNAAPTELEQQTVLLVDELAKAPIARDEVVDRLGLDSAEFDTVLELTTQSQLVQLVSVGVDDVLYSPFLGFEQPGLIADLVRDHGSAELADAFETIRGEQGMPISRAGKVVSDAVSRGLLLAPSVKLEGGHSEAFATLPYTLDTQLLQGRKPVLDKALAVVACLRAGQHFGGYSNMSPGQLVYAIDKLLREGQIGAHSSSERQYRTLNRAGVIKFGEDRVPWGNGRGKWVVPTLIDTDDNREALRLARDLITHGESMSDRGTNHPEAAKLLDSNDPYSAPLRTVHLLRDKSRMKDKHWQAAFDKLMGHKH